MGYTSNLLFYAKYNDGLDADYSKNGNTAVDVSAFVSLDTGEKKLGAGSIKHDASAVSYVRYSGGGDVGQVGTLSCWYRQTGVASNFHLFDIKLLGDNSRLRILRSGGDFGVRANDSSGTLCIDNFFASSLTNGVWYHVELDFNFSAGASRLFLDGVQQGSTLTDMFTRDGITDYLYIGTPTAISTEGWTDDFRIYNTVLHSANFTPPTTELIESRVFRNYGFPNNIMRGFGN